MKRQIAKLALIAALTVSCGPVTIDEIRAAQCPPVAPLATADYLQVDGATAHISDASLTCYIDKDTKDLLAEVTLFGRLSEPGVSLPFFVAALNEQGEVISRTQFKVTPSTTSYSYPLPKLAYGTFGSENLKARLVVGFVLTPAQLDANRAAYAKKIGISR